MGFRRRRLSSAELAGSSRTASRGSCAIRLVVALIAGWSGSGCTNLSRVLNFEKQMAEASRISRIGGQLEVEGASEGVLVVVLARVPDAEGAPLVGVDTYVRLRPGSYAFPAAPGRYRVGAYEDRNQNGLLDPGERTRANRDAPVLQVGPGEEVRYDILLGDDATAPSDFTQPVDIFDLVERTPAEQRTFSLWAWSVEGRVCEDLSDPDFGPEAGKRGLWEAMDFVNEGHAGIYFLEPYDPDRVPVLFVHGISGYPQEFETLIESLDRDRFQPWFYFYPSGFPLADLSRHLATLVERLHVTYRFQELAVVAHSMGGLVARGAIFRYEQETGRADIRLLLTISTPWGGDIAAEQSGSAPVELPPSLRDMSPTSDYLRWLFYDGDERSKHARRLPAHVEFHMIIGFRMRRAGSVANDGTVSVASQARLEAQEQAATMRALDYSHGPILHSDETVSRLNQLLAARFP
jgi:pimeloyl-ACP methyl ester carboxylesterase